MRAARYRTARRALLAACLAAPLVVAQRDEAKPEDKETAKETWREDPFTGGDAQKVAAAGYVRVGRLEWTTTYGTSRIEQALGDVKIRWLETPHFRLGSGLREWKVPGHERDVKKRLAAELARLKTKLPTIDADNVKTLAPWVRAHLYAQRLEDLWTDFTTMVGVREGQSLGRGPFLGVKGKFNVLLLHEESHSARFVTTFTGGKAPGPTRWYWPDPDDGFVFVTAVELSDDAYEDDTALLCHVAFNVVHNMIDALNGYGYDAQVWWQEGLAHSFRRRISSDFNGFTHVADQTERIFAIQDWERRTLGLIQHELVRPLTEIGAKLDYEGFTFADHMAIWSRIEFLRSLGDEKVGAFVLRMKQCGGSPPSPENLARAQDQALRDCFGFESPAALDAAWIRWATKEYRGKK